MGSLYLEPAIPWRRVSFWDMIVRFHHPPWDPDRSWIYWHVGEEDPNDWNVWHIFEVMGPPWGSPFVPLIHTPLRYHTSVMYAGEWEGW